MPPTGSVRSAPKPLPISNLLHSQHLSDDQPKDVVNEPLLGGLFVKTRLAYFVFLNEHPLNVLPKALVLDLVKTVYLLLDRTKDEWAKVSFSLLGPEEPFPRSPPLPRPEDRK